MLVFVPWAFGKGCLRLLKALTAVWLAAGPQQMQVLLPLSDSRKWESWILNLSIVGLSLLLPPTELGQVASLPRRGSLTSTALGL